MRVSSALPEAVEPGPGNGADRRRQIMCGRFGLFEELEALARHFHIDPRELLDIYQLRWNISPTMPVLTIEGNEDASASNSARLRRWGLSGHHSRRNRGANRPLINARAETVHELWSFREAFESRRCLIPASGFYEWRKEAAGGKTPIWFHREDRGPVAFAGIWSKEDSPQGPIEACAIITCAPNTMAAQVHHRMPVILPPGSYSSWLSPDSDTDALQALLQPVEWPGMGWHPVAREVNRASNDHPSLVERVEATSKEDGDNLLLDFP